MTVSSLNVSTDTIHDTIKVYDWLYDPSLKPPRYVKSTHNNSETTTVVEIDMNPYQLLTYSVGDFVLRDYPPTKAGKALWGGDPMKINVNNIYTIHNLVTQHSVADVTHFKLYDPK